MTSGVSATAPITVTPALVADLPTDAVGTHSTVDVVR
jgi:hypothetical protein